MLHYSRLNLYQFIYTVCIVCLRIGPQDTEERSSIMASDWTVDESAFNVAEAPYASWNTFTKVCAHRYQAPSTCIKGQSLRQILDNISWVLHYSALISAIPRYSAVHYLRKYVLSMHGCIVFALFISLGLCYVFLCVFFFDSGIMAWIKCCCLRWVLLYTREYFLHDKKL